MSYGMAAGLQAVLWQALAGDAEISELCGGQIFDALPQGMEAGGAAVSGLWISLGPEEVRDASDAGGSGAWHEFTLSVLSDQPGFLGAKALAGAVCALLTGTGAAGAAGLPDPAGGRLVGIWFLRARARLEKSGGLRRIDLRFRARVEAAPAP